MDNSGALLISLTLFCFSVIHVDLEIHGTTIWAIRDLIAAFSLIIKSYLAGHEVNLRPSALLSRFFSKRLKTYNHTSDQFWGDDYTLDFKFRYFRGDICTQATNYFQTSTQNTASLKFGCDVTRLAPTFPDHAVTYQIGLPQK